VKLWPKVWCVVFLTHGVVPLQAAPNIGHSLRGIRSPPNTWFLGPTHVHIPIRTSIGLSVFVWPTVVSNRETHRRTHRPRCTCGNRPPASLHSVCAMRPKIVCGKTRLIILKQYYLAYTELYGDVKADKIQQSAFNILAPKLHRTEQCITQKKVARLLKRCHVTTVILSHDKVAR